MKKKKSVLFKMLQKNLITIIKTGKLLFDTDTVNEKKIKYKNGCPSDIFLLSKKSSYFLH